jgi:hypothetical protein
MRARVIKIVNSQRLRSPKPILVQTGIMDDVEIEVEKNQIIIRPDCHSATAPWQPVACNVMCSLEGKSTNITEHDETTMG